jgi:aminoglycoside 3-N-acetyltransferase
MTPEDIRSALFKSDVLPGDVLMIHGDVIVAAQLKNVETVDRVETLFATIIEYLGSEGTLVVPSFTYSFTKSELFDVQNSKSVLGAFSECFRQRDGVVRSRDPIFSVCAIGKHKFQFEQVGIDDCFGEDSCFGLLYKLNGKVMNLGCDFDVTFTHYVEQKRTVSYRYFKCFIGNITDREDTVEVTTKYYVGDTNINYTQDLTKLRNLLISKSELKIVPFGRIASYTVSCSNFLDSAETLLSDDEFALIEEDSNG